MVKKASKQKATRQPVKRERAPQQRAIETRRKLLEAAIEEFAAHGFQGASTRRIAENAGTQHTLLTYHFDGKDGLWRETISSILSGYRQAFDIRLQGLRGVDDVTKLRLIHEDFIRFGAHNLNFHRIMAHIASVPSAQLDWMINEYLQHTFNERAALIRSAQKAGRYVEGDPYHLEYVFIGAVTRIYMLAAEVEQIMGRSPLDPAFVDEHVRVCLGLFFRDPPIAETAKPQRKRPTSKRG